MRIFLIFIVFLLGVVAGASIVTVFYSQNSANARQIRQGGYALINPLLECELSTKPIAQLATLEENLKHTIASLEKQDQLDSISVYFRDLNNGPTFGINENEEFAPASLLKIPVLMAFYKEAEQDKQLLSQKLRVEVGEDRNTWETYRSKNTASIGKEYTIAQLLRMMIVSSDNNARAALMSKLSFPIQDQVYEDLGVAVPRVKDTKDFMDVEEFASFFRILYNASYLTDEYSERALQLLTETEFKDGLVAGVPPGVRVAHKFGERTFGDEKRQLHDCGIVYLTDRPYLLCIMSRGYDYKKLAESIETISRIVYQDLSSAQ